MGPEIKNQINYEWKSSSDGKQVVKTIQIYLEG